MTGARQAAADLVQEVFLKAYRHMESFRGDSKFTTWLHTMARNHCLDARVARDERREALPIRMRGTVEDLKIPARKKFTKIVPTETGQKATSFSYASELLPFSYRASCPAATHPRPLDGRRVTF
jgi:RNA polymerase sigma factor (sigma-70 family)